MCHWRNQRYRDDRILPRMFSAYCDHCAHCDQSAHPLVRLQNEKEGRRRGAGVRRLGLHRRGGPSAEERAHYSLVMILKAPRAIFRFSLVRTGLV